MYEIVMLFSHIGGSKPTPYRIFAAVRFLLVKTP